MEAFSSELKQLKEEEEKQKREVAAMEAWLTSPTNKGGVQVEEIVGEPGNYALFYSAVASAITNGTSWPISNDDALLVAQIIDQARKIGTDV